MQRFEGAYQHYHPAHTSMTAPEDYRNKPLATTLATLNLGTTKGKTYHPASTLPLRPKDSTATDCGRIETWMKEEPRKHDTTEAELDGRYKTSLSEYCGDINDIRSAMSAICTRYLNGDVTAAGFALVANFALHLVELRTDEHDLTTIEEDAKRSKKMLPGENPFWKAMQQMHESEVEKVRSSGKGLELERTKRIKAKET
jgi:hypothetical protein